MANKKKGGEEEPILSEKNETVKVVIRCRPINEKEIA